MSGDYFSIQKRGGVINANTEHQDTVAVHLAIELLHPDSIYSCYIKENEWSIMLEGNDDIEIMLDNARVYVQVKSAAITPSELKAIFSNFKNNYENARKDNINRTLFFRINALNGFSSTLSTFEKKLSELHNSRMVYTVKEYENKRDELIKEYDIDSKNIDIIDNLYIDTRRLLRDGDESFSLFAYNIRKFYNIKDFGDRLIKEVYTDLINLISQCRRNRSAFGRQNVIQKIHKIINLPETVFNSDLGLELGYKHTEKGYEKSEVNIRKIRIIYKEVKSTIQKAKKEWIKVYWKVSLLGLWEECSVCGHPLMANVGGLFGIACPDCGFQPYVSLALGCKCGSYTIIKKQPALSREEIYEAVIDFFKNNSSICSNCKNEILDEFWEYRLILLPFPYPMKEYVDGIISNSRSSIIIKLMIILAIFVYIGYWSLSKLL